MASPKFLATVYSPVLPAAPSITPTQFFKNFLRASPDGSVVTFLCVGAVVTLLYVMLTSQKSIERAKDSIETVITSSKQAQAENFEFFWHKRIQCLQSLVLLASLALGFLSGPTQIIGLSVLRRATYASKNLAVYSVVISIVLHSIGYKCPIQPKPPADDSKPSDGAEKPR
eukprot:GHVQ01008204.1.p1 GENE.GHVQ01008204.1~~GHVQ01008204.1.p1  ORF type:complete len:171 (-),score=12.48 GHVQ01008204.1:224-736(-)